jgi:hypothetical protein
MDNSSKILEKTKAEVLHDGHVVIFKLIMIFSLGEHYFLRYRYVFSKMVKYEINKFPM